MCALQSFHNLRKLDLVDPKETLLEKLFKIEANIKNVALENEQNENNIRELIDERRYIAAILRQFDIDIEKQFPSEDEEVKLATTELRFFIDHWCSRIIHFDYNSKMLNDKSYCHFFLDHHIPRIWDFERDCFIFVNPISTTILEVASERGIKNIVIVSRKKISFEKLKNKSIKFKLAFQVKNKDELERAILSQHGIINRIQAVNCGNGKVSEKQSKEINESISSSVMIKNFNFATYAKFSFLWAENFLINYPEMFENKLVCDMNCRGYKSAVIVGAGPSLKKNIKILKKYRKETLIICVLHALPAFKKYELQPDIVVHLDCDPLPSFYKLTRPSENFKIKNFVIDSRVPKEYFNFPCENIYSPWYNTAFSKTIGIRFKDYSAPNVTIFGVRLAENLGIKNIALMGNDLSFTDDEIYAENCSWQPAVDAYQNNKPKYVKGYYGDTVKTASDFVLYINQFETLAKRLKRKNSNFNFYNCTEGGAFLQGWENIPLKDFIKFYSNEEKKNIFSKKRTDKYQKELKKNGMKFLKSTLKDLKKAKSILNNLIELEEIKPYLVKNDYMNRVALFNKLFTKLGKKNWLLSLAVYDLVNEVNLYNRKDLQTISSMNFYQNTSEVIKKLDYACLNSVNRINEIQKK